MVKILLIDDEETFCQLLKMNLESLGRFEVEYLCDPRQAQEKAAQLVPDLILLDLMMPHMEGSEVARRLKENPATAGIPVFFLTALSDGVATDARDPKSVQGVISKPVMVGDLVRQIDQALAPGK